MFSRGVERALRASLEAHAGQHRKGRPDIPYVSHPVHVALILARVGVDEVVLQAALLHDVVEDCEGWTVVRVRDEFGPEVAQLVDSLTDPEGESWEVRKAHCVAQAEVMDQRAAAVKAADKLHNLHSLTAAVRRADSPDEAFGPFSRGVEQTLQMSRRLVDALVPRVDSRLGQALDEAMTQLERLVLPD